MVIVVSPLVTLVMQRVSLAVNIIITGMICLVAADHPVIVIDSLIQGDVNDNDGKHESSRAERRYDFFLICLFLWWA